LVKDPAFGCTICVTLHSLADYCNPALAEINIQLALRQNQVTKIIKMYDYTLLHIGTKLFAASHEKNEHHQKLRNKQIKT